MSCPRPRPVTATVTKQDWDRIPTGVRNRDSLSSGSSTASLVSVLDHDSCESLSDSEEENIPSAVQVRKISRTTSRTTTSTRTSSTSNRPTSSHSDSTTTTRSKPVRKPEPVLSTAWQTWMIEKAKLLRIQQKGVLEKQLLCTEEEEKRRKLKEQKQHKVEEEVQQWIEKKAVEKKTRKSMDLQKAKAETELEEVKKKQIEEKAAEKYQEWLDKTRNQYKEHKRKISEEKKKKEEEENERKKRADLAFEKWCKEADKKPKSVRTNYGYTCGKLTGYYDRAVHPVPGFCNPLPWQPIHVPSTQEKKKNPRRPKTKSKNYLWNPNKYI